MSFGNFLGKVVGNAVKSVNEKAERVEKLKKTYDRYDDKRLIEEYKRASGERKLAASILLKERGYGNQS